MNASQYFVLLQLTDAYEKCRLILNGDVRFLL